MRVGTVSDTSMPSPRAAAAAAASTIVVGPGDPGDPSASASIFAARTGLTPSAR